MHWKSGNNLWKNEENLEEQQDQLKSKDVAVSVSHLINSPVQCRALLTDKARYATVNTKS